MLKIDVLVYLDSNAILDLLRYLAIRNDAISFVVSMDERIAKIIPNLIFLVIKERS